MTPRNMDVYHLERRAQVHIEQVAIVAVVWALRAWFLSPEWLHRAARRARRRA